MYARMRMMWPIDSCANERIPVYRFTHSHIQTFVYTFTRSHILTFAHAYTEAALAGDGSCGELEGHRGLGASAPPHGAGPRQSAAHSQSGPVLVGR